MCCGLSRSLPRAAKVLRVSEPPRGFFGWRLAGVGPRPVRAPDLALLRRFDEVLLEYLSWVRASCENSWNDGACTLAGAMAPPPPWTLHRLPCLATHRAL